ncbi:MAG TPA: GreA/GreB family elongation factor [Burkholderiales bacterium]|nr:GreA/GreB family elongation factor [Burkholderiales bacterium]
MSRAFVKEETSSSPLDDVAERQVSPHPNYMTEEGFNQLKRKVENLSNARLDTISAEDDHAIHEKALLERDLRYYQARLQSAIVVGDEGRQKDVVRFGAWVTLEDDSGKRFQFRLVGEDEADATQGMISWVSPLASQLLGKQAGNRIIWLRENKATPVEIMQITYAI